MAHFSDHGVHCSDPYCRQQDFLPFTCNACNKVFCKDHFKYSAHSCEKGLAATDKRVIVCPLCQVAVPLGAEEDENAAFERHAASDACQPAPPPPPKPRCPVQGCKEKLTSLNTFSCGTCHKKVCLKHRFEDAHDCRPETCRAAARRAKGAGAGAVGRTVLEQFRRLVQ
uniref:AN1-type domain-containing protein n=1 Tax=Zooxanthella nutricula TaxID=1333877 RepID=A0A6U9ILE4_9DINO